MRDLRFTLNLPPLYGDNAAEFEEQIRERAHEFFGPDAKLAFPNGYTAKPMSAAAALNQKRYEVRDLTVRLQNPSDWDSLLRTVYLPDVEAGDAAGIQADIDQLVREFFGSDDGVSVTQGKPGALTVSALEEKKPASAGKRVYRAQHVVAQQSRRWSTV